MLWQWPRGWKRISQKLWMRQAWHSHMKSYGFSCNPDKVNLKCSYSFTSLQNCKLHLYVILFGRTECLKLLVAVTILTCATEADRAEALNKWIQVAIDTKTALGNLYGFCGVMMGLCMPQVSTTSWKLIC
jgi:hypothetical protein